MNGGIWVELFDGEEFQGERLYLDTDTSTPQLNVSDLSELKDNSGKGWDERVKSVRVGPYARVELHRGTNFGGPSINLQHGSGVYSFGELNEEFNSLRLKHEPH